MPAPAKILELTERFERNLAALTPHDKTLLQRHSAQPTEAADKQIDRLVYELYELTAAEIGVAEGR